MIILVNEEQREVKMGSIGTLYEIVTQIESTLPQGQMIIEVSLNGKILENNWSENAKTTYILEDDIVALQVEESIIMAMIALKNSKKLFEALLKDFEEIADSFRTHDEGDANAKFIQGIENLQNFLKLLVDACILLGRPITNLVYNDTPFMYYFNDLGNKLDKVITIQKQKDWVLLADMIEYEMIPAMRSMEVIYKF